jgi:hypothetical protein
MTPANQKPGAMVCCKRRIVDEVVCGENMVVAARATKIKPLAA